MNAAIADPVQIRCVSLHWTTPPMKLRPTPNPCETRYSGQIYSMIRPDRAGGDEQVDAVPISTDALTQAFIYEWTTTNLGFPSAVVLNIGQRAEPPFSVVRHWR